MADVLPIVINHISAALVFSRLYRQVHVIADILELFHVRWPSKQLYRGHFRLCLCSSDKLVDGLAHITEEFFKLLSILTRLRHIRQFLDRQDLLDRKPIQFVHAPIIRGLLVRCLLLSALS